MAIVRYEPDAVEVNAETSGNGLLVLSDTFYPGWKARVDGRDTPILRADVNLRAVAFPAGRHTVVFTYEPATVRWGIVLSLAGALAALAALGFIAARARRAGTRRELQT